MKKQLKINEVENLIEKNAIKLENSSAIAGTIKDSFENIMTYARKEETGKLLYELEITGDRLETFLNMLTLLLIESGNINEEAIESINKIKHGADDIE